MDFYTFLGVSLFTVLTNGQMHPDDTGVNCHICLDTDLDSFPKCLQHSMTCTGDHVCQIIHGFGSDAHIPEIYCRAPWNCRRDTIDNHIPCAGGGVKVDDEVCEVCCDTNECVSNVTNYLRLELVSSKNLFCPGQCHTDTLQDCVHTGRVCDRFQFCQVEIDHTNRVHGECLDDFDLGDCQREMRDNPCPVNYKNSSAYNSDNYWSCIHDCCVTNECLFPHFGIHMASAVVPTTSTPTGGQGGSDGNSLWEQLRGSCKDTFNLPLCQSLKNDHDLCKSRLALSMCPETCGICAAVGSAVCEDTTSICPGMKSSDPAFCDTEEAFFECPTTCGRCDQLLESVVLSVLGLTTPAPSAASGGIPVMTTPSPVDCTTIKPDDCVHFGPLCQTTFLGVVCPAQCDFCANGEGASA